MNQKKDHQNKTWIIIVAIVVALVIIFGVVKINSKKSNQGTSASKSSVTKVSSKTTSKVSSTKSKSDVQSTVKNGKLLKKEPTMKDFNKISVADTNNKGSKGTTLSEAKKLLGEPTTLTENKTKDVSSSFANWTYNRKSPTDSISLSVTFTNDQAVSKGIVGFKVKRDKKITLSAFNEIKEHATYEEVVKALGEPNGITDSLSNKKSSRTAIYSSDLDANEDKPRVDFVFSDNKLLSKNQIGLK
ncbi:DUF3862 domain-containing protein [Xylocopilactobacillus apicola]|uniref:DUF3862 domain-containing protein n=1 Tax=Xylocopilactobacillus apicola TaxID=2932184 RepID=A0AAU9DTA4_9LACO|nr:DUF3862 domain-containing protein [Xylocopilactobacillus apicola]BDR58598.1 hypothetical protein XA3_10390 [Xylocopilactobacillus apicola]